MDFVLSLIKQGNIKWCTIFLQYKYKFKYKGEEKNGAQLKKEQ